MTEEFKTDGPDWPKRHLEAYLRTDGEIGHFIDFTPMGGPAHTPCLVLETIGRKSGEPQLLPLIYGEDGENVVIIASKGGAPAHPAWYLNLQANPEVKFQILGKKYRSRARTVASPERERLYEMMAKIYPPYVDYQRSTDREIPVVILERGSEIDRL